MLIILSLYDSEAKFYSPVITVPNINAFLRTLADEINRPEPSEVWAKHPREFQLVELGTFDDGLGVVTAHLPVVVSELMHLVNPV